MKDQVSTANDSVSVFVVHRRPINFMHYCSGKFFCGIDETETTELRLSESKIPLTILNTYLYQARTQNFSVGVGEAEWLTLPLYISHL
jgi:hypothetical protein